MTGSSWRKCGNATCVESSSAFSLMSELTADLDLPLRSTQSDPCFCFPLVFPSDRGRWSQSRCADTVLAAHFSPMSYSVLRAAPTFFLEEASQDPAHTPGLPSRAESFFSSMSSQPLLMKASHGYFSVENSGLWNSRWHPVTRAETASPLGPGSVGQGPPDPAHGACPLLFGGQDWAECGTMDGPPCLWLFVFCEPQALRGSRRVAAELSLCVPELELRPSWCGAPHSGGQEEKGS